MADALDYTPFTGEGRVKVQPRFVLPNTQPIAVTGSTARLIINMLVMTGRSNHSGAGATLWVQLWWLHWHKKPYALYAMPGEGYELKLLEGTLEEISMKIARLT